MKLLEGKTAIVTEAPRGIGKEIVVKLSERGRKITFTDLFEDENMKNTKVELK